MEPIINESIGRIYMVDGKEWLVGEQKISKWSKAKCNQPLAKCNQPLAKCNQEKKKEKETE